MRRRLLLPVIILCAVISGWFARDGGASVSLAEYIVIGSLCMVLYPLALGLFLFFHTKGQCPVESSNINQEKMGITTFFLLSGVAGAVGGVTGLLRGLVVQDVKDFTTPFFLLSAGIGTFLGMCLYSFLNARRKKQSSSPQA